MSGRRKTPDVLPPKKNPSIPLNGGWMVPMADVVLFRNEKYFLDRNSKYGLSARSPFSIPATLFWLTKKKLGFIKRFVIPKTDTDA